MTASERRVVVERLGARRLAVAAEPDALDPAFRLLEQLLAVVLQRLAALVDRDRLLEVDLALFESLDDRLELLELARGEIVWVRPDRERVFAAAPTAV